MNQRIKKPYKPGKNKRGRNKYATKLELSQVDWDRVEKIFTADRENFLRKIQRKTDISPHTQDLLNLLAGGAIFSLSLVFPTLPMAIAPFIIPRSKFDGNYFSQSLHRLKKQKLVELVEENGQTLVRITEEGRIRALRYKLSEIQVKKPKVWDKKWRLVIFDIPEKYKRMRDIFRHHLKTMGFYMLQKSVWVHPYPCGSEIEFLRQVYNVGINVSYILAQRIENVDDLREHFNL